MYPFSSDSSSNSDSAKEELELTINAAKVGQVVDVANSFKAYLILGDAIASSRFPQVSRMVCC